MNVKRVVYFRATANSSHSTQCCIKLPSLSLKLDIFESFIQRHLWVQGRARLYTRAVPSELTYLTTPATQSAHWK